MNKINELRDNLKVLFEGTDDVNVIQQLASINNIVSDIETETNTLLTKQDELKRAYKEAVMHGCEVSQKPVEEVATTPVADFNTMLQNFIDRKKN